MSFVGENKKINFFKTSNMEGYSIGVIGNGSWGTALVKILTDGGQPVNWWIRNTASIDYIKRRRHNPNYLHSAYFDVALLNHEAVDFTPAKFRGGLLDLQQISRVANAK